MWILANVPFRDRVLVHFSAKLTIHVHVAIKHSANKFQIKIDIKNIHFKGNSWSS